MQSLPFSLSFSISLTHRLAVAVLQRNIRKYLFLRDWKWWKLYTKVKPLLNVARTEDELRQKEEELNKLREKVVKDETARKELEESQTQLMEEKNQLYMQLQRVSYTTLAVHIHVHHWYIHTYCIAGKLP